MSVNRARTLAKNDIRARSLSQMTTAKRWPRLACQELDALGLLRFVARIALAQEPRVEIGLVQADDAADLEDRKWIVRPPRHVPAPALRTRDRESDALPSLDIGAHFRIASSSTNA